MTTVIRDIVVFALNLENLSFNDDWVVFAYSACAAACAVMRLLRMTLRSSRRCRRSPTLSFLMLPAGTRPSLRCSLKVRFISLVANF